MSQVARGIARANRVGVMTLIFTLFQHGVPALFYAILSRGGVDLAANGWGMAPARFLAVYLLMYLLMLLVPLWLCRRLFSTRTDAVPATRRLSSIRLVCLVLFCVALCVLANIAASLFSDALFSTGLAQPRLLQTGDGSFGILLFELTVFALVPAVLEEYWMRGIVLQTLRPLGDGVAVVMSALVFALAHGNLRQTPYALLMGIILGGVYTYTDRIGPCIAIHAITNAAAVTVGHLSLHVDSTAATLWQWVLLIVVMLLGGIAALWLWRYPLARRAQAVAAPLSDRVRAICRAPLWWMSVAVMIMIMIVYIL